MIRIAMVEDDKKYVEVLRSYLKKYEEMSGHKFIVTEFSDGEDIAVGYKGLYDIILMDIEMMFMDGMKAAGKIREVDSEVVIIFITNVPQYVMDGYKVDALDYVLKPLTYFALSERIERAIGRMNRRKKQYLSINVKGGMQKIDVSRIRYIEVLDHDSILYTLDGVFLTKDTLKNLEDSINSVAFFRCNKCYLVNLEYVEGVQGNNAGIGDDLVQISRSRKKDFMDALNNYIHEVSK